MLDISLRKEGHKVEDLQRPARRQAKLIRLTRSADHRHHIKMPNNDGIEVLPPPGGTMRASFLRTLGHSGLPPSEDYYEACGPA